MRVSSFSTASLADRLRIGAQCSRLRRERPVITEIQSRKQPDLFPKLKTSLFQMVGSTLTTGTGLGNYQHTPRIWQNPVQSRIHFSRRLLPRDNTAVLNERCSFLTCGMALQILQETSLKFNAVIKRVAATQIKKRIISHSDGKIHAVPHILPVGGTDGINRQSSSGD